MAGAEGSTAQHGRGAGYETHADPPIRVRPRGREVSKRRRTSDSPESLMFVAARGGSEAHAFDSSSHTESATAAAPPGVCADCHSAALLSHAIPYFLPDLVTLFLIQAASSMPICQFEAITNGRTPRRPHVMHALDDEPHAPHVVAHAELFFRNRLLEYVL